MRSAYLIAAASLAFNLIADGPELKPLPQVRDKVDAEHCRRIIEVEVDAAKSPKRVLRTLLGVGLSMYGPTSKGNRMMTNKAVEKLTDNPEIHTERYCIPKEQNNGTVSSDLPANER